MDLRYARLNCNLSFPCLEKITNFQPSIDSGTFDREYARVALGGERGLQRNLALRGSRIRYQNLTLGAAPVVIQLIGSLPGPATAANFCLQWVKNAIVAAGLGCRAAFWRLLAGAGWHQKRNAQDYHDCDKDFV